MSTEPPPSQRAADGPLPSEWPGAASRRLRLLPDRPRLGAYRLCAEIATGGMATVFLADTAGSRVRAPVAIKRIHPHLAKDQTFVDMFYDEACIASRIQHPNVCNVFDLDVHEGEYFIAMEYLMGEPLSRAIKASSRKRDLDRARHARVAAAVVADACRGLHAAHELVDADGEPLDVVHRDVSPDNIFVTFDGVTKVVDFGVASASRQLHRTRTGMLKGKYAYLQPEVLVGRRADRRGDIWGMGVVLWEFLTLERLFHRESDFQTLRAVGEAEIRSPSVVAPGTPPALDAIVSRCLSRDPDDRYRTAKEVEEALHGFLTAHGGALGPSALADWLAELFPTELDRQRQFVEMALHVEGALEPSPAVLRRASTLRPPPMPTGSDERRPDEEAPIVDDALTTVFAGERTPPGKTVAPGSARIPTPMSMQLPPSAPRSRGGLRALPTVLATAALATSAIALLSMRDGDGPTPTPTVGAPAVPPLPAGVEIAPRVAPGAAPSSPVAVATAAVAPAAVTVGLPRALIARRRAASSSPIELEKGTYRLDLEPRRDGSWALTVQPYEPVMVPKPSPAGRAAKRAFSPASFRPTEP